MALSVQQAFKEPWTIMHHYYLTLSWLQLYYLSEEVNTHTSPEPEEHWLNFRLPLLTFRLALLKLTFPSFPQRLIQTVLQRICARIQGGGRTETLFFNTMFFFAVQYLLFLLGHTVLRENSFKIKPWFFCFLLSSLMGHPCCLWENAVNNCMCYFQHFIS